MSGEYEVGYKRPPVATRFRKGQSGNPKGRAKTSSKAASNKAQIANEMFYAEYNRKIPVTIQGQTRKMSIGQVTIRKLIERSAKGEIAAVKLVLTHLRNTQQLVEQHAHAQSDYKPPTLADFYGDLRAKDEPDE